MKRVIGIVGVFAMICGQLFAQGNSGAVVVFADAKIDSLVALYETTRTGDDALVQGYRIQIASGSNQSAINKVKSDFYSQFSDLRPNIVYEQPYFKLRVGYYRTKYEAYNSMMRIREEYPDAFIIRDKLEPKDLNK